MIDTFAYVTGSSLLTRQIVEALKNSENPKLKIHGKLFPILASLVINFVLSVGWAAFDGKSIDSAFVYAVLQAVISSIYHDIKKAS